MKTNSVNRASKMSQHYHLECSFFISNKIFDSSGKVNLHIQYTVLCNLEEIFNICKIFLM